MSEAPIVRKILEVLLEAHKLEAARIRFEPGFDDAEPLISFFAAGENPKAPVCVHKMSDVSEEEIEKITQAIIKRGAFWPKVGRKFFSSVNQKTPVLLFALLSEFRLHADIHATRKAGTKKVTLSLDNIRWNGLDSITDCLEIGDSHKHTIIQAARTKQGIVLCNAAAKSHEISGTSIMLALRPDALVFTPSKSPEDASKLLELSKKHLVVVQEQSLDPVDLIFRFCNRFRADETTYQELCEAIVGAYVHTRVKRSCSSCAKPTPVPDTMLEQIPEVLHSNLETSYLFSRGCAQCNNSVYRGTLGLDSAVEVDDAMSALLTSQASIEVVTRAAYDKGTRTLLEDGLEKVFSGLTSFEEVLGVIKHVSSDFELAIAARKNKFPNGSGVHPSIPQDDSSAILERPKRNGSQNRRVLIIEDDSNQRDVLEIVFQTEGFDVLGAEDGQKALETLRTEAVDVIVCDVMMPVMNGIDFVQTLRKNPSFDSMPVLMLTAASSSDDEYDLLTLGADDYCDKNIKRKILIKRVQRLLERSATSNPLQHFLAD